MNYLCISWNIMHEKFNITKISWSERLSKIIDIIKNYDLIFLQEVDLVDYKEDFRDLFSNYNYFSHEITKKRTNFMGNIIFYKKTLIKQFEYQTSCSLILILNRILFVNVHLKAGLVSGLETRKNQMESIFNYIQKIKTNNEIVSIIICGDFNTENLEEFPFFFKNNFQIMYKGTKIKTCLVKNFLFDFDHVIFLNCKSVYKKKKFNIGEEDCPSDHSPVIFEVIIN
jgi:mRNA deadenylase 3'-5' endonuclease subunit Ccr4